jgi:hypothetical protein
MALVLHAFTRVKGRASSPTHADRTMLLSLVSSLCALSPPIPKATPSKSVEVYIPSLQSSNFKEERYAGGGPYTCGLCTMKRTQCSKQRRSSRT